MRVRSEPINVSVTNPRARLELIARWFYFVLLASLAAGFLVPFLVVVFTAVKTSGELYANGSLSVPMQLHLENFLTAWRVGQFDTYFKNSAIIVLVKVPLGILISASAAFAFTSLNVPLRTPILVMLLLGLVLPVHITLQPLVILLKNLHLSNTIWALIPPYVVFGIPFQMLVLSAFFRGIPRELFEAARMDGLGDFGMLFRMVLPLSVPAISTLFVIDAVNTWNEFLISLVLINSDASRTVPVGLLRFQGAFSSQYPQMMAGVLITILPLMIVYLFLQRYLIAGLTLGATKG
jgi:raffinose/stachyose/melibiose transport system permease protein